MGDAMKIIIVHGDGATNIKLETHRQDLTSADCTTVSQMNFLPTTIS